MDRDDRGRYFIIGSVMLEIVTPVFRERLKSDYKSKSVGSLKDFINSKTVIHILFHLRHKNIKCCTDSTNCRNRGTLPLNYSQWDLLYTENPGPPKHHCHCLYTTNNVKLDDLDITLSSLILLNCCSLTPNEEIKISDKLDLSTAEILTAMNINNGQIKVELSTKLVEILQYVRCQSSKEKAERQGFTQKRPTQLNKLGQPIFTLHHQIDLSSEVNGGFVVSNIVMMNDGRLVMCFPIQHRLLICNTDGSQVNSIPVQCFPLYVTAVNNCTVAVTLAGSTCLEMYDINNKFKIKSIS